MQMQTQVLEQYIHIDQYGNTCYYKDKEMKIFHRLDGPAIEWAEGSKFWYVDGERHRINGPALERANGDKAWYVNGKRHRIDGPAVEYADGYKAWWVDGKRHRIDGPAVEYLDGDRSWYVDDKGLSEAQFIALTAPKQPLELTLDQIAAKFGISVEQLKVIK